MKKFWTKCLEYRTETYRFFLIADIFKPHFSMPWLQWELLYRTILTKISEIICEQTCTHLFENSGVIGKQFHTVSIQYTKIEHKYYKFNRIKKWTAFSKFTWQLKEQVGEVTGSLPARWCSDKKQNLASNSTCFTSDIV